MKSSTAAGCIFPNRNPALLIKSQMRHLGHPQCLVRQASHTAEDAGPVVADT